MEQADQQPLVSLKLGEITTICLQMGYGAAPTIIFLKVRDLELWREYRLWEIAEVPELVGLVVYPLH